MTHDNLVELARKWLRNNAKVPSFYISPNSETKIQTVRCRTVLTEQSCANEIPDAIGWFYGSNSILIECKISRSDFLIDKKKMHRNIESSAGDYRYFLTTKKLISIDELPENWGLLETSGKRIYLKKLATKRVVNQNRKRNEFGMMWSELSLIQEAMEGKILYESKRGKKIMNFLNKNAPS